VKENQLPAEINSSDVVAAIALTLQYIGFAPTFDTTTVVPVGSDPEESAVVTANGAMRAEDADGINPVIDALNVPAIGNGFAVETTAPFAHSVTGS
jgi:hypothetical protein